MEELGVELSLREAREYNQLDGMIKDSMKRSASEVVKLGYFLRRMMEEKLYCVFYSCFDAYLEEELHMDYTAANRFIGINKKYSIAGKSEEIDEKYAGYSQGLLVEMLSMPPELEKQITPDMTVRQAREIKREAKQKDIGLKPDVRGLMGYVYCSACGTQLDEDEQPDRCPECGQLQDWSHYKQIIDPGKVSDGDTVIDGEYREVEETEEVATSQGSELTKPDRRQQEYLDAFARYFISCNLDWMREEFLNRVQDVTRSPEEIKAHLGSNSRWWHFKINEAVASINLFDDYVQLRDENHCFMGDFDWFYLAAAIQRMWNVVSLERAKTMAKVEEGDSEEDAVLEPFDEIRRLRGILEQENKLLSEYLKLGDIPEPTVYRQKMIVGALANMVHEFESAEEKENAVVEMQRTELPVLKNNDQRKEWLENYKEWGLWYRDENIDVNYYKFDFADGSRLVVAEYPQRYQYWREKREDEAFYHLLEKNKQGYKKTYDEVYRNTTDSETYLVEFLKKIQKKGGGTKDE